MRRKTVNFNKINGYFDLLTFLYIIVIIDLPILIIKICDIGPEDNKSILVFLVITAIMYGICAILILPLLEVNKEMKEILKKSKIAKSLDDIDLEINKEKYYSIKNMFKEYMKTTKKKQDKYKYSIDISYYFDEDNLVYKKVSNKTINQIVQSLTGVGIFGTFLGVVNGVSGLNLENSDAMKTGIVKLLQGVKLSFNSSLYGIMFSLIMIIIYKMLIDHIMKKVHSFNEIVNSLAEPETDENQELKEEIKKLRDDIKKLKDNNELLKMVSVTK